VATVLTLLAIALAGISDGYSTPRIPVQKSLARSTTSSSPTSSTSTSSSSPAVVQPVATVDRGAFLAATATSCLALLLSHQPPALAKEVDLAVKGTKSDPAFQACLSECVYECTKPKGQEQKSRAECIPECKVKCATSKAQLMLGTATKKD
jgi:hypothetical protein